MGQATIAEDVPVTKTAKSMLKRELTLLPLFGFIYFTVCGGSFGTEQLGSMSGPGLMFVLFIVTPLLFSIPNMLMVREMQSMMPVEGGYYHWLKTAFGPFVGFMGGWMNWVVSWVDVTIYPVLAASYLAFFIPVLNTGTTIAGIQLPSWLLSWFVAIILIWAISLLNIRGARLTGLTTDWLGIAMMIPLLLMSVVGFAAWIKSGTTVQLPFLASGQSISIQSLIPALSTGLYVAMWNFMGWELPTAAGDEIVNPKRTYPLAMLLVLIATLLTYSIPAVAGMYGGAGENGKYQLWGLSASDDSVGIIGDLAGSDPAAQKEWTDKLNSWGVDPTSTQGYFYPDIAHAVADKLTGQTNGPLASVMGSLVTIAAILSMTGLFIGNGLGGTRVPFALAEDGMMPKFLVKVHPKFGTPWVSILICGVIFSIFSLQAFSFLVVMDVFLNMVVLMAEFFAMWKMRIARPDLQRQKVPGGWFGLVLVTLAPLVVVLTAIISRLSDEGISSLYWALGAIALGMVLYIPLRIFIKPGIPDVDPFGAAAEEA
ncbi:MAG TPA: APC family permease [Anaerolineaceae bacterium]|nr:APC family permease [Anaerolineaceae bacterium]